MAKKKILIMHATAGSGHTKAAQAIYKAFGELKHDCEVEIVNSLDYMTAFFRWTYPRIYVFMVNRIPLIWGAFYYILDNRFFYPLVSWIRHLTNWVHSRRLAAFFTEKQPDLIINTHFLAPDVITMTGKKNIKARVISVVTDYRLHSFWLAGGVDTYVGGYEETKEDLLRWGVAADKIKVLGIPIDLVFSKRVDAQDVRKKLGIKEGLFTILVGSGGFGIGPVAKLVEELIDLNLPMQLLVVCGKNRSLYSAIKVLEGKSSFPITTFRFVDNMHELMEISDLTITKAGGIVCAEAMAKNLPIVGMFPIPGQEVGNLSILLRNGAGLKLKRLRDAKGLVKDLCDNRNKLSELKENIERIKKPNAAIDIAKLAIEILSRQNA